MVSEGGNKKDVASGSITFILGPERRMEALVPVAEAKAEEAIPLMEDLFRVVLNHYYKSHRLSPRDVARILASLASATDANQIKLTEGKYNGRRNHPRT